MATTDDRSKSARLGCSTTRHTIVGTAAHTVIFSSWMRRMTSSGSNRPTGMTILMPAMSPTTRPEWQPATWNSGDVSSDAFGVDGLIVVAPGFTIPPETDEYIVPMRFEIIERWVEMAPFGRPAVPLV